MTEVAMSPPISPPHNNNHKRVSFGENPVKTFIYEKESDEPTPPPPVPPRQPFTDPAAPPSRVRVTTEENDTPHPIAPPNQIEEIRRVVVSPPLPSHKMDEQENPFKPEDILYHEVDPIVEQYLHKPFPPSLPGSTHGTPIKQNGHTSQPSSPPAYLQNGLTKADLIEEEKLKNESSQPLLSKDREHTHSAPQNGKNGTDDMPPPANVELVHIKKKKCGCCSLQ